MPLYSRRSQRRKNLLLSQLVEQEADEVAGAGDEPVELAVVSVGESADPMTTVVINVSAHEPVGPSSVEMVESGLDDRLGFVDGSDLESSCESDHKGSAPPNQIDPEVAARFESDRKLIERAQRGDAEAFGKLVEQYQKSVHSYLRARLLRSGDAEDLTQEVFLRMYAARARFDSASLVQPFLMGIARNVLREYGRSTKRRKEVIWTEICLELEAEGPPEDSAYEAFVAHLPHCLKGLTPTAQQALEMHYRKRMRYAAISQVLSRSVGAVKLLLFRARKALKKCLDLSMGGEAHD